jgi:hypothetical protein
MMQYIRQQGWVCTWSTQSGTVWMVLPSRTSDARHTQEDRASGTWLMLLLDAFRLARLVQEAPNPLGKAVKLLEQHSSRSRHDN